MEICATIISSMVTRHRVDVLPLGAALVLSLCFFLMTPELATAETQHCVDISNNVQYNVDEMEGTWYPVEIVLHRNDSKIYGVPLETQCPAVTFTISPKNKKILVMLWNSTEGDLEYKFQQKGGRGQWQAVYDQRGAASQENLQNLKASVLVVEKDKYMIVRFCSTSIHSSVILSRQNSRSDDMLNSAGAQLSQLVKYPAHERKAMCNTSGRLTTDILLTSLFVLLLLLRI